jgi:hypothetical protein
VGDEIILGGVSDIFLTHKIRPFFHCQTINEHVYPEGAATQIYSRLALDPLKQAMGAAQVSMAARTEILPPSLIKKTRQQALKLVRW